MGRNHTQSTFGQGNWDPGKAPVLDCSLDTLMDPHRQSHFRAYYEVLQMRHFPEPVHGLEHTVDPKGSYLAQVWNHSRPQARGSGQGPGRG